MVEETWVEIGGILIRSPVSAGTNLLLTIQCFVYYVALRSEKGARARFWGGFFFMMALASAAAILKHGFKHEISETGYFYVLWASSLTGGLSTYFAQRATVASHARDALRRRLDLAVLSQLIVFLGINLALGPVMLLLVANTAAGMLPVIVVEGVAWRRGYRAGGWIAGGLSVSILTGLVYVFTISAGPWMNHIDIAHVLMGISFFLMIRGAGPISMQTATA